MDEPWDVDAPGVVRLPSGRLVRGRALRRPLPAGPQPQWALHLRGRAPTHVPWPSRWLRWPDFWLPTDPADARDALEEVWQRSTTERAEIACHGGSGRTGTALACVAVLDGVPPDEAVRWVREHGVPRAVEAPWQRRWVARFAG